MPSATTSVRGSVSPPQQEFWQRYSPHHEFPLSSITSVTLHALVIVLLLLGAWVAIRLGFGNEKGNLPVDVVPIAECTPNGVPERKGIGDGPLRAEVGDSP